MNIDSFLTIGSTHNICEDYIIHGIIKYNNNDIPYIILSDGCSSSKHTDIGSRILTHSAKTILENYDFSNINNFDKNEFSKKITDNAIIVNNILGLKSSSLEATLMIMFVYNGNIYILNYGDGSIFINYKDNFLKLISFKFLENTPYYPIYSSDDKLKEFYLNTIGHHYFKTTLTKYDNIDFIFDHTMTTNIIDDKINIFDSKLIKNIFISSDGIDSFSNIIDGTFVNYIDIFKQMIQFKNTNGNFLKRIMKSKRGILNKYKKNHIVNHDDLSVGCINFND